MRVLGSRSNRWAGTWLSKGQGAWLLSTYKTTYSKLYQKPRDSEYSEHCLFIFTCWAPAQVPGMSVETQSVVNAFCQIQNLYKQKSDNLISVLKMHYAMASHFPPSESQSPDLDSLALAASLAVLPSRPPPLQLLWQGTAHFALALLEAWTHSTYVKGHLFYFKIFPKCQLFIKSFPLPF